MEKEYVLLGGLSKSPEKMVECRLSGIGKVNAAISTYRLIKDFQPDAVISVGCAGTFAPQLSVGDIVIASKVAYHDVWCGEGCASGQVHGCPKFFNCDRGLFDAASRTLPSSYTGLVISGDQFFISEQEDMRQKALYPDALAVDMESAAVAQVCNMEKVPFLAVKVISDTHLDGNQAEHYETFWSGMAEKSFNALNTIIGCI